MRTKFYLLIIVGLSILSACNSPEPEVDTTAAAAEFFEEEIIEASEEIESNYFASDNAFLYHRDFEILNIRKIGSDSGYDLFGDETGLISFNLPKGMFDIEPNNQLISRKLKSKITILFSETEQVDSPEAIWNKTDLGSRMKQGLNVSYFAEKKDWIVVSGKDDSENIVYIKGFYFQPENNFAGENGRNTQPWCQTVLVGLEYPENEKIFFDDIIGDFINSIKLNFDALKSDDFELNEISSLEDGSNYESDYPKSKTSIGKKITSNLYENQENRLKTILQFQGSAGSDGSFGSLTLSNNASSCKYVYSYTISGSTIHAKFIGSDCGAHSNNLTLNYIERNNSISAIINGQAFVFKSIF